MDTSRLLLARQCQYRGKIGVVRMLWRGMSAPELRCPVFANGLRDCMFFSWKKENAGEKFSRAGADRDAHRPRANERVEPQNCLIEKHQTLDWLSPLHI